MNEVTIFENPEFGKVRTTLIDGEPYFVGKDVAGILGYAKPENAIATHVDEDDTLKQGVIDGMGRIQKTTIINESGMYSLILGSKLPTAKSSSVGLQAMSFQLSAKREATAYKTNPTAIPLTIL